MTMDDKQITILLFQRSLGSQLCLYYLLRHFQLEVWIDSQ